MGVYIVSKVCHSVLPAINAAVKFQNYYVFFFSVLNEAM